MAKDKVIVNLTDKTTAKEILLHKIQNIQEYSRI